MRQSLRHREFEVGGYYHIFNRGNAKQTIFHDEEDYVFFLSLFDFYLNPQGPLPHPHTRRNYAETIALLAFCLMPNHFHLLLQQQEERVMSEFLQSLCVRYTKYRNKKYGLVGHTFQDRYKARRIIVDADLLHVSRYIHLNPLSCTKEILTYAYSSLQFYHSEQPTPSWLHANQLNSLFSATFGIQPSHVKQAYTQFISIR